MLPLLPELIRAGLPRLESDQTLLVQSGKPVGVFLLVLLVFVVVLGVSGAVEQVLQEVVTATIGDGVVNWIIQLFSAPFGALFNSILKRF